MNTNTKYYLIKQSNIEHYATISLKKQVLGGNDALEFTSALQDAKNMDLQVVAADLLDVDLINSSGLGMLVSGMSLLRKVDVQLVLIHVPEKVMKLLQVTHLDKVFKIFHDEKAIINEYFEPTKRI